MFGFHYVQIYKKRKQCSACLLKYRPGKKLAGSSRSAQLPRVSDAMRDKSGEIREAENSNALTGIFITSSLPHLPLSLRLL
jgi:hypothetical protein